MSIRSHGGSARGLLSLLLGAFSVLAAQEPAKPKPAPTAKAPVPTPSTRTKGKLKPVDINHATREELGFMLGINTELAAKIIANRPYKTKAELVVKNVFTMETYQRLRKQVVAK